MKRISRVFVLAAFASGALLAQDLSGTWQGVIHLPTNRDVREIIKIAKDGNVLKAALYSIDLAPGQAFPSSTVTLQGTAVKIQFPGIGATYNATMGADGNSMTGIFTQGQPLALNLQRATAQSAWVIPESLKPIKPMAPDTDPVFAVATIKPSDPNRPGPGYGVRAGQFSTFSTTLSNLITFAYQVQGKQILGGPSWLESEKYDIVGKPDGEGQPSEPQWRIMLQKLLADRFQLKFHRDKRELSVYTLTALKSGSKLTPSTGDPNGLPALGFGGLGKFGARNANMADFARVMESVALDRPIVDQTGIAGRFDFTLEWLPDEFQFAALRTPGGREIPENKEGDDLFTAIQKQLGLKFEATKAPAEVLIIDHAEKPSAN